MMGHTISTYNDVRRISRLNPDEVLSREAFTKPHRTVVDPEERQIEVLNQALKDAILEELRQ